MKSAGRLLCRTWPLRCKTGKTGAGNLFRPGRALADALQRFQCPAAAPPCMFYPFSAEAFRLTEEEVI